MYFDKEIYKSVQIPYSEKIYFHYNIDIKNVVFFIYK